MSDYSADKKISDLKEFQRATVAHVMSRFYGEADQPRFLVADETGLGKSKVAGGVVAKVYERLQHERDVKRVDVVYVCSNGAIAKQNLKHLRVTEEEHFAVSDRITMLAKYSGELRRAVKGSRRKGVQKPLNVFAFTPGTSFEKGWRTGKAEERALLFLILRQELALKGWDEKAAVRIMQATTRDEQNFRLQIARLEAHLEAGAGKYLVDRSIAAAFIKDARSSDHRFIKRFRILVDDVGRRKTLTETQKTRARVLIGELRGSLARASIELLEPDLIILDEFQRFRGLVDVEDVSEAAELAQQLFGYRDAKVLLLSATPYKPYTLPEESAAGEEHYRDFLGLLQFLRDDEEWLQSIQQSFSEFREELVEGRDPAEAKATLESMLLEVMCRTERPPLAQGQMLSERVSEVADVSEDDLGAFIALRKLSAELKSPGTVEYWKSAPYFVNFLDGYKMKTRLEDALGDRKREEHVRNLMDQVQLLDRGAIERYEQVDMGNGRLRELAEQTVDAGLWKLLWMPPSMPYYQLEEPFKSIAEQGATKRLVFSSWTATPTAVAALLSYEADRQMFAGSKFRNTATGREKVGGRLEYSARDSGRSGLSALALFWPHPRLATLTDPLSIARDHPDEMLQRGAIEAVAILRLKGTLCDGSPNMSKRDSGQIWDLFFSTEGALPVDLAESWPSNRQTVVEALAGGASADQDQARTELVRGRKGLSANVDSAVALLQEREGMAPGDSAELRELAELALYAPGNTAWRALDRLIPEGSSVTPKAHWQAAATIAAGVRAKFNSPEAVLLIKQLDSGEDHWRAVLEYCARGCLQAVLDEYLYHLWGNEGNEKLTDEGLLALATTIQQVLTLPPGPYKAFDPHDHANPIGMSGRFALRYPGKFDEGGAERVREVREAFNSPFWPFVRASTSSGQEGIDFHWWCSAVVHWNVPANPIDFEQREGRVHRYGGHAIRRNIAQKHRGDALREGSKNAWDAAYAAADQSSRDLGEFAPFWVYPGDAQIERHLLPYPLSADIKRAEQLKKDLALYRLALGQPRQEDMLKLIGEREDADQVAQQQGLDLRPPAS